MASAPFSPFHLYQSPELCLNFRKESELAQSLLHCIASHKPFLVEEVIQPSHLSLDVIFNCVVCLQPIQNLFNLALH